MRLALRNGKLKRDYLHIRVGAIIDCSIRSAEASLAYGDEERIVIRR